MQLIDLDLYPEQETALAFPVPPLWFGFEVIGPVPYEMRADWSRGKAGLSVDVWFARPASLEVWQGYPNESQRIQIENAVGRAPRRRAGCAPAAR